MYLSCALCPCGMPVYPSTINGMAQVLNDNGSLEVEVLNRSKTCTDSTIASRNSLRTDRTFLSETNFELERPFYSHKAGPSATTTQNRCDVMTRKQGSNNCNRTMLCSDTWSNKRLHVFISFHKPQGVHKLQQKQSVTLPQPASSMNNQLKDFCYCISFAVKDGSPLLKYSMRPA